MSPENRILFNGALTPKLDNSPFASCFFMNLVFLLPHTAHSYDNINLPLLVSNIFEATFFVFLLHIIKYVNLFVL